MDDITIPVEITVPISQLYTVGRLGAVSQARTDVEWMVAALDMAERRILRLEALLRRHGFEPESVELPPQ